MNNFLKLAYEAGVQQAIKEAREGWNVRDSSWNPSDLLGVAGAVSGGTKGPRLDVPHWPDISKLPPEVPEKYLRKEAPYWTFRGDSD